MKKGQVYLLAVIIMGFLIYTMLTPVNFLKTSEIEDDFQEISKNYQLESAKLLNELLNTQNVNQNFVEERFLNFTVAFTSYSKSKNPNFGLVYAFPFNNKVFLENYADSPLNYSSTDQIVGCLSDVTASISFAGLNISSPNIDVDNYRQCINSTTYPQEDKLILTLDGLEYPFTLTSSSSNLVIINKESIEGNTKIFISE